MNASEASEHELDRDRDVPLQEWSERLWSPPPSPGFEPAFRQALVDELKDRTGSHADALVAEIERAGAIITAHHVCPTNGPTFGAMDCIATAGRTGPILVLAWSGVPMSNPASSGAVCFRLTAYEALLEPHSPEFILQCRADRSRALDGVSERRLTLIPPMLRDALVYECVIPARLGQVLNSATPLLSRLVGPPTEKETYAAWALRTNEAISRSVFGRENLWYVDLNRVARRYLLAVLEDSRHAMNQWLQSDAAGLRRWPWFYARVTHKRGERVETINYRPERLLERLRAGELCPGLMPVFCALRTLSRIRLFGGVRQVAYLEEMVQTLLSCALISRDDGVPGALLTGRLTTADGSPLYPFDVAAGTVSRDALPSATTRMGTLWQPLRDQASP